MTTSRPVLSWPSVSTTMRLRRLLSTRVWCVSASPSSQGSPACLMLVCGEAPVPPSCPLIRTTSAWALATPAATVPTPTSETSLTLMRACGVGVLQIVDQLGQVLDRVNIVMRRRRDQPDAGGRVAYFGNPGIDFLAGQLPALAGFGALGHLDLQLAGVDQVIAGDAEAGRGHLFDRAVARIAVGVQHVARRVLAAFAGVAAPANAVHRNRQGLVGLFADRTVGHGAGFEALHDRIRPARLPQSARAVRSNLKSSRPRSVFSLAGLVIDELRVALELLVIVIAAGLLQLVNCLGVEEVVFAVFAPLVLAANLQGAPVDRALREGMRVAHGGLTRDDLDTRAADARGGPGEVFIHEVLVETDRFEDLRAAVALDGRDAHLGEDLDHAL